MNAHLQEQFDRVESALDTLVDSITSYNPSIPAASSLLAADDDLSRGLEQLSKHQSNHALLLSLRTTSESLDDRIKSTISLLADTRKELLEVLPAPDDEDAAPTQTIDYKNLLSYAQRIVKYSVPPSHYRLQGISRPQEQPQSDDQASDIKLDSDEMPTPSRIENGVTAALGNTDVAASTEPSHLVQDKEKENKALATLDAARKRWLDPDADIQFTPWPSDDVIRRGALSRIQAAVEQGLDPSTRDLGGVVTDGIAGAHEAGAQTETEAEPQERPDRRRESFVATGGRLQGGATQEELRAEAKRKEEMFQGFDLYNPEEEELK